MKSNTVELKDAYEPTQLNCMFHLTKIIASKNPHINKPLTTEINCLVYKHNKELTLGLLMVLVSASFGGYKTFNIRAPLQKHTKVY